MDEIYEGMRREQPDTLVFFEWAKSKLGSYRRMDGRELEEAFVDSTKHGPSNNWAGMGGILSWDIRRLLEHVLSQQEEIDSLKAQLEEDDTELYEIDDEPLSIFSGDREPTLSESLTFTEHQFGNVELRMW